MRATPSAAPGTRIASAPAAQAHIRAWLRPQAIALDVEVRDCRHLLAEAAAIIARSHGLDAAAVNRALWRREQVGTTALGQGVAIPHARIVGIDRPLTLYLRPRYAIDCDAPDGKPVANFLVIMVPADGQTDDHLELLALVAQTLADPAFRHRLAGAGTPADIDQVFAEWATRDATAGAAQA